MSSSGLCAISSISFEGIAKDAPAFFRDAPTSCARDFCQQAAHVQSFEGPSDGGTLAMALGIVKRVGVEDRTDVLVAKSLDDVLAGQYSSEQTRFRCPCWVETCITPLLLTNRFGQFLQIVIVWRWVVDDRQSFQITLVAGQGMALIVVHVANTLAQGKPTLYEHAIKGYQGKAGVMPAKGGNAGLPDADVKAAVDYMVAQAK